MKENFFMCLEHRWMEKVTGWRKLDLNRKGENKIGVRRTTTAGHGTS